MRRGPDLPITRDVEGGSASRTKPATQNVITHPYGTRRSFARGRMALEYGLGSSMDEGLTEEEPSVPVTTTSWLAAGI